MTEGIIFDIKEFAVHDGPGIRVTVFFKGCPLRCNWCHNPEGLSFEPELIIKKSQCINCGRCLRECEHEICKQFGRCLKACPKGLISIAGRKVRSDELAYELMRYKDFLEMNGGGVTLSGGEPLAQPDFLIALLKELKPMHIAVETSGYGDSEAFNKVIELSDILLFDIKHMDTKIHRQYTGVGNELIQKNLRILMDSKKPFIARIPLIPKVTDTISNLKETAKVLSVAKNLVRVELLPYNPLAGAKYDSVGKEYQPRFDINKKVCADCGVFEDLGNNCKAL